MKRMLWNITLSSVITLAVYIAMYSFWGAILSGFENNTSRLIVIALMTTTVFGFFLLYTLKIRGSVGEEEIFLDYKNREYISWRDDFMLIINRESKVLICIAAVVLACFLLNTFDSLVFEKKTISFPTFFFAPMCLFASVINIPFAGYLLSALLDYLAYIFILLIYRKKKYDYWMNNKV